AEDKCLVSRNHEPGTGLQLSFELARRPTCVTHDEQRLPWTLSPRHRLYELRIRRHRDPVGNFGGLFEEDIVAMKNKARAWTDGTAVMDDDLPLRATAIYAKPFEQVFYGAFCQRSVDDQAEGAFRAMLHHVDDGLNKPRVSHFRSRHEYLSGEVIAFFSGVGCD